MGRRKAAALLDAGALVRLVCLEPRPNDCAHSWLTAPYVAAHLEDAVLVIAAASPEVNQRIVGDAARKGVWVSSATQPKDGDFILPASVRHGDFVVAVSTGGVGAPDLAQAVRDRLAEQFDDAFAAWVALLAELRPLVLARGAESSERHAILERLCRWEWLERLRLGGR